MMDTEMHVREMLAESGIEGQGTDELFEALVELGRYVDEAPPEPSPKLASLIAGLPGNPVIAPLARRRGRMLVAGLVTVGTVGAGGIAAAANELPSTAQSLVADFSARYLPFELPHPDSRREPHQEPVEPHQDPVEPVQPAPTGVETDADDVDGLHQADPSTTEVGPDPTATASAGPSQSPPATSAPTSSAAPSPSPTVTPGGEGGTATDPQADGSPSASPSDGESSDTKAGTEPTDPATAPSGTASPSPTANTRTEITDNPSPSPSPATSSGTASPSSSTSPSAGWSDAP